MSYTFLKRNVFNLDLKRLTSEQARISKRSLFHSRGALIIIWVVHKIGQPHSGSPICLITSMILHWIGQYEILLPTKNLWQFKLFSNLKHNYFKAWSIHVMSYYNVLLMLKSGLLICTNRVTHITDLKWNVWLQYKGVGMGILQNPQFLCC